MEAEETDKIIKELIDFFDNRTILEVACGTGAFSHEVDRVANRIVAIDVMKNINVEKNKNNIDFIKMDAQSMGFKDSVFDTIVFYNALAHIKKDILRILIECFRVLNNRGVIVFISTWPLDYQLHSYIINAPGGKISLDRNDNGFRVTVVTNKR
jgi:ubiquinone/menaquinone biosynthesis C-methylase UbiE